MKQRLTTETVLEPKVKLDQVNKIREKSVER